LLSDSAVSRRKNLYLNIISYPFGFFKGEAETFSGRSILSVSRQDGQKSPSAGTSSASPPHEKIEHSFKKVKKAKKIKKIGILFLKKLFTKQKSCAIMYADDTRDIGKKPCLPRIFTRRMLSSRHQYFIFER
jgi:hypothetical protein